MHLHSIYLPAPSSFLHYLDTIRTWGRGTGVFLDPLVKLFVVHGRHETMAAEENGNACMYLYARGIRG